MNKWKNALSALLRWTARTCLFNALIGGLLGLAFGLIANLASREFYGYGATGLTLIGGAVFIVFFFLNRALLVLADVIVEAR